MAHCRTALGPILLSLLLWPAQPPVGQELSLLYTGEYWHNASGGIRTGSAYLDNLDLTVSAETERLGAWANGHFFAYALYNNGKPFSASHVGGAQTVSNIEAPEAARLHELWYQHEWLDDTLSLRFGLYDLNSEFYVTDASSLFIQSTHGIGTDFAQTGLNGPSIFPVTSLAARLSYCPGTWCVRGAVFDGVPGDAADPSRTAVRLDEDEGALLVAELVPLHGTQLRAGIGYWEYTADFEVLATATRGDGNNGWYAFLEGSVSDRVQWFLRYGEADDDFNQFRRAAGLGALFTGALAGRDEDSVGIALAWAQNGAPFETSQRNQGIDVFDAEVDIELFYHAALTPWLTLQPDIHYVIHPGTDKSLSDALVIGLRFQLSFEHDLRQQ